MQNVIKGKGTLSTSANSDVTTVAAQSADYMARVRVLNLDTVTHNYYLKVGGTKVDRAGGVPAGQAIEFGPFAAAAADVMAVGVEEITTTTASNYIATGQY